MMSKSFLRSVVWGLGIVLAGFDNITLAFDESPSAETDDGYVWGRARRGWQVGMRLLSADGSLQPGDPVVFQFALKNATDEDQTVVIQQFEGLHPTLGAKNRISLNIHGSSQQKHQHTIKAQAVLEEPQYRVVLDTAGWLPGEYFVSRATPFWVPDKDDPNRSSGLGVRLPLAFQVGDPSKTRLSKIPSADSAEEQIYWGEPVSGLVVGMRLPQGRTKWQHGESLKGDLFIRNLSRREIEFEYEIPGVSDWNTHVETPEGDYVRLQTVWYSGYRPRVTRRLKLKPFQQVQIFTSAPPFKPVKNPELSVALTEELPVGPSIRVIEPDGKSDPAHPRHLITAGGEYRWFAHISLRQFAVKDLNMVVGSAGVPFTVTEAQKPADAAGTGSDKAGSEKAD